MLCMALDDELSKVQRLCEAVGHTPLTSELWTTAVAMNDTRTEVAKLQARLHEVAISVGMTDAQWNALRARPANGTD
ncbi:hypothetical protein CYL16_03325 [Mycobacterium sp. EPG1]|nr:hypothetical protein CYL16_03325 [Mycobacterium sp. EPG1]